jgi:hypothetical protein
MKYRRLRLAGHVARVEETTNIYTQFLWRKSLVKYPLGRLRSGFEDDIKTDVMEMELAHHPLYGARQISKTLKYSRL